MYFTPSRYRIDTGDILVLGSEYASPGHYLHYHARRDRLDTVTVTFREHWAMWMVRGVANEGLMDRFLTYPSI